MEYKIYCKNAKNLISTIFGCFKKKDGDGNRVKIDPQGNAIDTWDITSTDKGIEVLIHTTQQWEEVGNVHIDASENNDYVIASFRYWTKWTETHNKGNEDTYYLGRFTELILVHFYPQIDKVEIL